MAAGRVVSFTVEEIRNGETEGETQDELQVAERMEAHPDFPSLPGPFFRIISRSNGDKTYAIWSDALNAPASGPQSNDDAKRYVLLGFEMGGKRYGQGYPATGGGES